MLLASATGADKALVELPHVEIRETDTARIMSGAQFFAQHCQSCHSMVYLRYDALSNEAGVKYGVTPQWPVDSWNGRPPPDLSLVGVTHRPEWLYGYLKGYYVVEDGYDNIVMPNTSMPNPYPGLQGNQILNMPMSEILKDQPRLYQALRLESSGSIPPHVFNEKVADVVTYLVYAADPSVIPRHQIGPYVLIFLLILSLAAFFLYQSYKTD